MTAANRLFCSLVGLAGLVTLGLGFATARLIPVVGEPGPVSLTVLMHWCLRVLASPSAVDELVAFILVNSLPVTMLCGCASVGQQWWATRRFLQRRLAPGLAHPPARLVRVSGCLGLTSRLDVVRASVPYAFCYGLCQRRVCVSTGLLALLDDTELEAVLLHERHHLDQWDPLKLLVARALSHAFFFVPLLATLARQYATVVELTADDAVIRAQGHGRCLVAALYKLLTRPASQQGRAAVADVSGVTATRIDHLLRGGAMPDPRRSPTVMVASVAVFLIVAAIGVSPDLMGIALHLHPLTEGTRGVCRI